MYTVLAIITCLLVFILVTLAFTLLFARQALLEQRRQGQILSNQLAEANQRLAGIYGYAGHQLRDVAYWGWRAVGYDDFQARRIVKEQSEVRR